MWELCRWIATTTEAVDADQLGYAVAAAPHLVAGAGTVSVNVASGAVVGTGTDCAAADIGQWTEEREGLPNQSHGQAVPIRRQLRAESGDAVRISRGPRREYLDKESGESNLRWIARYDRALCPG